MEDNEWKAAVEFLKYGRWNEEHIKHLVGGARASFKNKIKNKNSIYSLSKPIPLSTATAQLLVITHKKKEYLVPKRSEVEGLLKRAHEGCGHASHTIMEEWLHAERYFWTNYTNDVQKYVQTCETCQKEGANRVSVLCPFFPRRHNKNLFLLLQKKSKSDAKLMLHI